MVPIAWNECQVTDGVVAVRMSMQVELMILGSCDDDQVETPCHTAVRANAQPPTLTKRGSLPAEYLSFRGSVSCRSLL